MKKIFYFLFFIFFQSSQEKEEDQILNLPGINFTISWKQYSGYLTVDLKNERKLFYWFLHSSKDYQNDPLILWYFFFL